MRPLTATLSKNAFTHNIHVLRTKAPNSKICAVIKANGYGHRTREILPILHQKVDYFAVSCIEEALEVRALGYSLPVLLLEGVFEQHEYTLCAQNDFSVALCNIKQYNMLKDSTLIQPLDVFIKVDTGMHRLGIHPDELLSIQQTLKTDTNVRSVHVMSHFASADEEKSPMNQSQQQVINNFTTQYPKCFCNSAAVFALPDAHGEMVRTGLALYGISPFSDLTSIDLNLKPALTLSSKLIHHQIIKKGEFVGYNATYQAQDNIHIGVVACGYADGYPREITADAYVLIQGYKAPIVGRVSMDMLTIDLSGVPETSWNKEVILFGNDLPIEQVAQWAKTIPYTILTHLPSRIHFQTVD